MSTEQEQKSSLTPLGGVVVSEVKPKNKKPIEEPTE